MSLRRRIATAILGWASEQREVPVYSDPVLSYGAGPEWKTWSTAKAVKEGYKASYAVYAITTKLSDSVKQVPWLLKRKTKDGSDLIDKHDLIDVLRQPNPEHEWSWEVGAVDLYKSLVGDAYQLISQEKGVHIWMLRPDRVRIKPDETGHIGWYEYSIGSSKPIRYEPEEIIHHRFFDPSNDLYGLAPLQAAARIVDTSNATVDWNKVSMNNRTRPDMIFWPDQELSKDQYNTFRDHLNKQAQGKKNAKKTLISPYKGKMQVMGFSAAEMDFLNSFSTYEDAVCWVFGIDPEAMGRSRTTYKNKEWAIRSMWEGPVEGRLRAMRDVYNHKFNPLFGTNYPPAVGDLYLDFDMSNTPAVTGRRKEQSEEAQVWSAQGVPFDQINERLDLGFEPFPGSDKSWRPINMLAEGEEGGEQTREVRSVNLETDEQKAAQWLAVDRDRQAWEKKGHSLVSKRFDQERDVVVKQIAAGKYDVTIDGEPWRKMLTPLWIAVVEFFGNEVWKDLELSRWSYDHDQRYFDPYTTPIEDYINTHVAEAVEGISLTSKAKIKAAVQAGLDEGESSYKISQRVRGMYNGWSGPYIRPEHAIASRCMTIARTEVGGALGYGHHEAAKQSGIVETKTWLSSGDDRVRESHKAINGETVKLNERYSNKCMYPCDPSGPSEEVVNCRCNETYGTR